MWSKEMRVAIVGAPGTGKTTCAADTVADLREYGYSCEFVPEFAREFILANNGIHNVFEQVFMAREQKRREEILSLKKDLIVVSDSPYILNQIYACLLAANHKKGKRIDQADSLILEMLYKEFHEAMRNYDIIALAEMPEETNHSDGVRIHTLDQSMDIQRHIKSFLDLHGGPDITLTGQRYNRKDQLINKIKELYDTGRKRSNRESN
jgi:nicotinamide riboside kinase